MFTNIDRIHLASGINSMLGTWLSISPWALGLLRDQPATGNSVIAGVVVATFGLVARAWRLPIGLDELLPRP